MVTILGLGAIGTIYATRFIDSGIPVRIAVDIERKRQYETTTTLFNGKSYSFDFFTPCVNDVSSKLIIIATKNTTYIKALELIRPIVDDETIILPLLNGISSERDALELFPSTTVLYGYFLGHTSVRSGRSVFQDGKFLTVFGDKYNDINSLSNSVEYVRSLFTRATIHYRIDSDMLSSLWQKFIINIGLNQITAYSGSNYGVVKHNNELYDMMRHLMEEASVIGCLEGVSGCDSMVEYALEGLSKMRDEDSSSMLQDIEAGRSTEIDSFAGEVLRLSRIHNVPSPFNQLVYDKFK